MIDDFWIHWSRPLNGCLVVVVYFNPRLCLCNPDVIWNMLQVLEFCGALVGGHDFGFTGTEGCLIFMDWFPCNWATRSADKKTREKWNLNISRGVPSPTALPNLTPQQVLQKAVSWWHSYGEGAVASLYVSLSWWCGRCLNACIVEEEFEWKDMPYAFVIVRYLRAWTADL